MNRILAAAIEVTMHPVSFDLRDLAWAVVFYSGIFVFDLLVASFAFMGEKIESRRLLLLLPLQRLLYRQIRDAPASFVERGLRRTIATCTHRFRP